MEDDRYFYMKDSLSIFEWVMIRMITIEILEGFYETFCEIMFNGVHSDFVSQIEKAFDMAKIAGRIKAKIIYGLNFDEIIDEITENITLMTIPSEGNSQPLKINQINKNISERGVHENKLELGFNMVIYQILDKIHEYKSTNPPQNNRGTLFFILFSIENHHCHILDKDDHR